MFHLPALILGFTVCAYWFCVGAMILRVRRQARGFHRVLIPAQRMERIMWVVWVPLVLGWMVIPFLSMSSWGVGNGWLGLPSSLAFSWFVHAVRTIAAFVGVACLLLSMWCWRHMGRDWRMGVDPAQQSRLLVNGPFSKVRHPIYALSMLLMLCSLVALPVPAMAVLAVVHVSLMLLKARNEERFLLERHGQLYSEYTARTSRFVPSIRRGYKVSAGGPARPTGGTTATGRPQSSVVASKLNAFQNAMLMWEEVHPYNAVHALRVSGTADVPALRRVIQETCRRVGLGELEVDREDGSCRYLEAQDISLVELPRSTYPDETLARTISAGMNTAFPDPSPPLRWTVFDEADGDAHHIVLTYRHLASDASGIEALLSGILRQYLGKERPAAAPSVTLAPPATRLPTGAQPGLRSRLAGLVRGLSLYFRFRHMHKMPDEREMGEETAVVIRSLPEPAFKRLSAACKVRGVGTNDAFLAALASAIAARTPHRRKRGHRHKLALGTIASARRKEAAGTALHFGVWLSDAVITLKSPDAPLDRLLVEIAVQTRARKADRSPETAASAMQGYFVRNIWPLLDIPHHRRSYRKLLPICGGVSTFLVDASRFGAAATAVTRYLRACPPGPAVPIVLAPTVFAGRLELSLVHRLSCLPPEKAEDLLAGVCEQLAALSMPDERMDVSRLEHARSQADESHPSISRSQGADV